MFSPVQEGSSRSRRTATLAIIPKGPTLHPSPLPERAADAPYARQKSAFRPDIARKSRFGADGSSEYDRQMETGITVIELGIVPVSYNQTRYAHWSVARRASDRLKEDIGLSLMASDLPRSVSSVQASALLVFPSRRRRDEGNFRTPLEKALGDALTQARWIEDDTPDQYRFDRLLFAPTPGTTATVITLEWTIK